MKQQKNFERKLPVKPEEKWESAEKRIEYLRHFAAYRYAKKFAGYKTVLEIGCGTGYGANYLSKFATNIIAIDISKNCVMYSHTRYKRKKICFLQATGLNIPLKDCSVDVAVSFQVIEHIEPEKVTDYLLEIRRVLKNGALFIVSTPNRKLRLLPFQKPWNPDHKKEYNAKELKNLLQKVFQKVEILGLSATKDAYLVEYNRVKQKPLFVYVINPVFSMVKSILPAYFIGMPKRLLTKKGKRSKKPENMSYGFSSKDFQTSLQNLDACIDLYGICIKKRNSYLYSTRN